MLSLHIPILMFQRLKIFDMKDIGGLKVSCCLPVNLCPICNKHITTAQNSKSRQSRTLKPAHVKAPVSVTDPRRLKLTLQEQRLRCAEFEGQLDEIRTELHKSSINIDHELGNDFAKFFSPANKEVFFHLRAFFGNNN